ncbi:MAG: signal peptidase I [Ruminococcus sp.]|nr:signal peptidase I [Ruminococcus sp.]
MDSEKIKNENEKSEVKKIDNNKLFSKRKSIEPRVIHLKNSDSIAGVYEWVHSLVFAVAIVVILLTFFVRLVDVSGTSMKQTLQNNDKVVVSNFFYQPKQGDIVVISHGAEYAEPIIKRVIATEGQSLSIDFDTEKIIVDGVELKENYIQGHTHKEDGEIPKVIPKGKVFVLGDNRGVSMDSRSKAIGLIDVTDIIGKAEVVVFPFGNMKYLANPFS